MLLLGRARRSCNYFRVRSPFGVSNSALRAAVPDVVPDASSGAETSIRWDRAEPAQMPCDRLSLRVNRLQRLQRQLRFRQHGRRVIRRIPLDQRWHDAVAGALPTGEGAVIRH